MKKTLLLAGLLLAVMAPAVLAAESFCRTGTCGLDINWGFECYKDAPANVVQTFPCNSNTISGTSTIGKITLSFAVGAPMAQFVASDLFLYGMTADASVPPWWQMGTGECRAIAFSVNNGYGGSGPCIDTFSGQSTVGVAGYYDGASVNPFGLAPNRDRVEIVAAVPTQGYVPLDPANEYFIANIKIAGNLTTGTGACAGCLDDHIWAFQLCQVADNFGTIIDLDAPLPGGNQCLWWQHQNASLPCAAPVPTRNSTWGQIKSLYR